MEPFARIVVEKRKVNPSIRDELRFSKFAGMALRFVFKGCVAPGTSYVLVFTDSLPIKKHRDAVVKTFKTEARADLPTTVRFDIYHHPRASNNWLQVVDRLLLLVDLSQMGARRPPDIQSADGSAH